MTAAQIAVLMSELIEIDCVALDDNFFEVGGNSLTALQLIARLEAETGARISLLEVVRAPTPRELISLIARQRPTGAR